MRFDSAPCDKRSQCAGNCQSHVLEIVPIEDSDASSAMITQKTDAHPPSIDFVMAARCPEIGTD